MQSCPYEESVLRKYSFVKPAAVNVTKFRIWCNRSLIVLTHNNNNFVCQYKINRTESAEINIWYWQKANILSIYCTIIGIHLLIYLCCKLINFYYTYGHGSQNILVFILLLLCYIGRTFQTKCKITLNFYNNTARNKFDFDLDSLKTQHVKRFADFYAWLQYYIQIDAYVLKYIVKSSIAGLKISNALNGSYINSDMEVDEKSKELKESINNQIVKEEPLNCHFELGKSENEYLAVINNVQNMKELECTQVKNSFNCNNHDDKIEIKNNINSEMVANGDLVNCLGNNSDSKFNALNDVTPDLVDNTILCSNIKKEETNCCNELNGNDSFTLHKIKENELVVEEPKKNKIQDEKNVNNCESKFNDCNSEKDKAKSKDHSGHNIVAGQTSSSSAATPIKKADDQSSSYHSSSSNSSSRSKYKEYKSSSHRSSSSSKNGERKKTCEQEKSRHDSEKKKSRSCHHKSDEKCHCKSHHHSRHHSKKSKKFQSVKTQCTADEIAYELRGNRTEISNPYFTRVPWVPHPQLVNLKYGRYYRIEVDRNGGASTVHLYMDEISHLTESQMKECAVEFIKLSYSEDESECAYHVMGIVHGAAAYLPDLVDYMADHYPTLTVKTGSLASRDNHTTTMSQYRDEVYKTYSNGTFRYAPLDQLSICGVLGEEVGAYFPDFVARLEQSPFMKPVMPWSSLSVVETDNPRESNDGPIFWVRPGEQMLPANEALKESARPKKRRNNELDNLAYIAGSRSSEARESLFMDRTKAHADQVGVDYGLSNTAPTAAVGVLKSVNCGHPEHGNRATKDVVAFHAQDYNELLEILMLDLYEPPQTQCTKWVEVSKLNTLRREGIRYAHVQLHDNDVYYLPRKIIHQFQTISSVASVAWHIRYKDYFSIMGAPNLHTPTGINKGQVFYEKKNVAVYYPPACESDLLASVTNPGSPLPRTPKKCEKLKDYSPFKHSPRKNHKVHSPRSSKKGSDSVPHTPNKKDSQSASNDEEKKNISVKKDGKSDDSGDIFSKRERENTTSKRLDSSHSSEHSSAKRERKESHESTSSHRKEPKNSESDLESKKVKGKSTKSPSKSKSEKSEHDSSSSSSSSRKSDESNSRHKRRDESKSKSHKHDKNSSHKKAESNSVISNGHMVESSVKSDDKHEKNVSLKRKNSDSEDSFSYKKIKEENVQKCANVIENGGDSQSNVFEEKSASESEISSFNAREVEMETNFCGRNSLLCNESSKLESPPDEARMNVFKSETNANNVTNAFTPELDKTDVKNNAEFNDLAQNMSFPCGRLSSDINPPLPCTSPPSNPPLPPNSPGSDKCADPLRVAEPKEESSCPSSSPVTSSIIHEESGNGSHHLHSGISQDKNNEVLLQGKKLKKKIVKKIVKEENESYDLLGDIMSQMDKKK